MNTPPIYTSSFILEKSHILRSTDSLNDVTDSELQTSVQIRTYLTQKYDRLFIKGSKMFHSRVKDNCELDHLIIGVSQKFLDLKSTIQLSKLLLFMHSEITIDQTLMDDEPDLNEQIYVLQFNKGQKENVVRSSSFNFKKNVHFNIQDGSNVSPPNDRRPGSWVDTWEEVHRIQVLLSSLHALCQWCVLTNLAPIFEALVRSMAYLLVRTNAQKALRVLRSVVITTDSLSISSLTASLELLLPELCLASKSVGCTSDKNVISICTMDHNRTLLRCKAVWMSAAVLRYHLRWLLDAPPAVLSTPRTGPTTTVAITSNPDEANSHYRSPVWSSVDLVFDAQQETLLFPFADKDPRLEACIYAIDSSHSPSSGSNLSYLFAEALRQMNSAIQFLASVSEGAQSSGKALAEGLNVNRALKELLSQTLNVEARVEICEIFLAAETARRFVWSVLSQTPGIETAREEVADTNGSDERQLTAWEHMQQNASMIVSLSLSDEETHLHLLSRGFGALKTLVSVPFMSDALVTQCRIEMSAFYSDWLDQLLISYSAPKPTPKAAKANTRKKVAPTTTTTSSITTITYDMAAFDDMLSGKPILKFPLLVVKGEDARPVLSQSDSVSITDNACLEEERCQHLPNEQIEEENAEVTVDEIEAEVRGKASRRRRSVCASQVVRDVVAVKEKVARKPPTPRTPPPPAAKKNVSHVPVMFEHKSPAISVKEAMVIVVIEPSSPAVVVKEVFPSAMEVASEQADIGESFPKDFEEEGNDWGSEALFCYDPEASDCVDTHRLIPVSSFSPPPVSSRPKRRASISATERIRATATNKTTNDNITSNSINTQLRGRRGKGQECKDVVVLNVDSDEVRQVTASDWEDERDEMEDAFDPFSSCAVLNMTEEQEPQESDEHFALISQGLGASAHKLPPRGRRASMSPAATAVMTRGRRCPAVSPVATYEEGEEEMEEEKEEKISTIQSSVLASSTLQSFEAEVVSALDSRDVSTCSTEPEESDHLLLFPSCALFSYDPDHHEAEEERTLHTSNVQPVSPPPPSDSFDPFDFETDSSGAMLHYGHEEDSAVVVPVVGEEQEKEELFENIPQSLPLSPNQATRAVHEQFPAAEENDFALEDLGTLVDDAPVAVEDALLQPMVARSRNRRASFTSASLLIRNVTSSRPRRGLVEASEIVSQKVLNTEQFASVETTASISLVEEPISVFQSSSTSTTMTTDVGRIDKKGPSKAGRRVSVAPVGRRKAGKVSAAVCRDDVENNIPSQQELLQEESVEEQVVAEADTTLVEDFCFPVEDDVAVEDHETVFASTAAVFEYDPSCWTHQTVDPQLQEVEEEHVYSPMVASRTIRANNRRASFATATERIRSATNTRRGKKRIDTNETKLNSDPTASAFNGLLIEVSSEVEAAHPEIAVQNGCDTQLKEDVKESKEVSGDGCDLLSRVDTLVPSYDDLVISAEGFPDCDSVLSEDYNAPVVKSLLSSRAKLTRRASVCANERIRSFAESMKSPSAVMGRDSKKKRKVADTAAEDVVHALLPIVTSCALQFTQDFSPEKVLRDDIDTVVYENMSNSASWDQSSLSTGRRSAKEVASSKIAELSVVKRAANSKRSRQRLRALSKKQTTACAPVVENASTSKLILNKLSTAKWSSSVDITSEDNKENESVNSSQTIASTSSASFIAESKTPIKLATLQTTRAPLFCCKRVPADLQTACMENTPDKDRDQPKEGLDSSISFSPLQHDEDDLMRLGCGMMHWGGQDDLDFAWD